MPLEIKEQLFNMFLTSVSAADAHDTVCKFAENQNPPIQLTWDKSSVKNFFDALRKEQKSNQSFVGLLERLQRCGHFVRMESKKVGEDQEVLSRFFVVFNSMKVPFKEFGSYVSLDATYAKNSSQWPLQMFSVSTNENCVLPIACAGTEHEEQKDYSWLISCFYECYNTLPRTIVIDGDKKIHQAIVQFVNRKEDLKVDILTCIWHLFEKIKENEREKQPNGQTDHAAMKGAFYAVAECVDKKSFDESWEQFVEKYGKTAAFREYLVDNVLNQKERWCKVWTNCVFHPHKKVTSGISESLHALMVGVRSGDRSLSDTLVLQERIFLNQMQKHLKRSYCHSANIEKWKGFQMNGFILPSVAPFLSSHALERMEEIATDASFSSYMEYRMVESDSAAPILAKDEAQAIPGIQRMFLVQHRRYISQKHQVLLCDAPKERPSTFSTLSSFKRTKDEAGTVCPCCGTEGGVTDENLCFRLPETWLNMYSTNECKQRCVYALGFPLPRKRNDSVVASELEKVLGSYKRQYNFYVQYCSDVKAHEKAREYVFANVVIDSQNKLNRSNLKGGENNEWVYCGTLENGALVAGQNGFYCGRRFHLRCIGLRKAPDRPVQCMECLRDKRYVPKLPAHFQFATTAMYHSDGTVRILKAYKERSEDGIATLYLTCSCKEAGATGLPCSGMYKVAQTLGYVLSYHHYDPFWFGPCVHKFSLQQLQQSVAFESNKAHVINAQALKEARSLEMQKPSNIASFKHLLKDYEIVGDSDIGIKLTGERKEAGWLAQAREDEKRQAQPQKGFERAADEKILVEDPPKASKKKHGAFKKSLKRKK